MLAPTIDTIRLTLHVLAAAIWVGGQIVMTGLVGPARGLGPDAPKTLARAFARLAWPAYAVLIVTDHDNVDYVSLADSARLVVDTRNACARAGVTGSHIVKA